MNSLTFRPGRGADPKFFKLRGQVELLTSGPLSGRALFSVVGTADFFLKQSIVPVVAWVEGGSLMHCIGTACVISCSGFLMTACHVLLDPVESNYGEIKRQGATLQFGTGLHMGVLIQLNPVSGQRGYQFLPFEQCWYWGAWRESPLFHEDDRFEYGTDIAICKVSELPRGTAHQPLSLSLNAFKQGEEAYAFGYAEMRDIPIEWVDGHAVIPQFEHELYVSVGEVTDVFPMNHKDKDRSVPGPCFDFRAKVPGKMSGGPILGAQGAVVRGIVSRSFSGEEHAFGAMLGPVMRLPMNQNVTVKTLMESGREGMPRVQGVGL